MRANNGEVNPDKEPFFLENPHGVVVSVPRAYGEKCLATKIGWRIAEPEDVPEEKQYPIEGDLTERGLKSRVAIKKSREARSEKVVEKLNLDELRIQAKEAGVDKYWLKNAEKLQNELDALKK